MQWPKLALLALCAVLAACFGEEPAVGPVIPDESLTQAPKPVPAVELSKAAEATKADILKYARAGALRSLARLASETDHFVSNNGGEDTYLFWDLMRRTGSDPALAMRQLLDGEPGLREVDGELWFVWPDLAARPAEDLIPEKLGFQERARLKELIGEEGIARIRAGEGYPGTRTAIAEDGRWLYFVFGE